MLLSSENSRFPCCNERSLDQRNSRVMCTRILRKRRNRTTSGDKKKLLFTQVELSTEHSKTASQAKARKPLNEQLVPCAAGRCAPSRQSVRIALLRRYSGSIAGEMETFHHLRG